MKKTKKIQFDWKKLIEDLQEKASEIDGRFIIKRQKDGLKIGFTMESGLEAGDPLLVWATLTVAGELDGEVVLRYTDKEQVFDCSKCCGVIPSGAKSKKIRPVYEERQSCLVSSAQAIFLLSSWEVQ
jgi:hypothetical protein